MARGIHQDVTRVAASRYTDCWECPNVAQQVQKVAPPKSHTKAPLKGVRSASVRRLAFSDSVPR
eukprot:9287265-Pyramimonas_sp.AAC.1